VTLDIADLSPSIGTEVRIDREALLRGDHADELRALLDDRGLLLFREVGLDDREQVSFARTLGQVVEQGVENIYKVTLDKTITKTADYLYGTFHWHVDGTEDAVPPRASVLSARRLSSTGGATEWANTYAAYEALSPEDKELLADLRIMHSQEPIQRAAKPGASEAEQEEWRGRAHRSHPAVWTHESGRKSLLLGFTAMYVEGMDPEESRILLDRLQEWSTQPRFSYRHHWQVGDMVVWDNTGTMHRVEPYAADSGREMSRTTLVGEEAVA
jgi:alpha-ketoglutarate-dependent taurine dioxygenase